jgi:hypothetical protein
MGVNVGKPTYDDLLETLTFLVSALESQNPHQYEQCEEANS